MSLIHLLAWWQVSRMRRTILACEITLYNHPPNPLLHTLPARGLHTFWGFVRQGIQDKFAQIFRRFANARIHSARTLKDEHGSENVRFGEEVEARHKPCAAALGRNQDHRSP